MFRVYSRLLRLLRKFFAPVWGRKGKITVILIEKKTTEIIQYKLSYFSRCHCPLTFFFIIISFCFCRVNAVHNFLFFYTNNHLNVLRACLCVKKKGGKNVQGTSVFFFFFLITWLVQLHRLPVPLVVFYVPARWAKNITPGINSYNTNIRR